jgi:hypothetical protein
MAEFSSISPAYGQAFLDTIAAAYKTIPGAALIAAAKLRLSTDPAFAPTFGATIAALAAHEATFTGYPAGGAAIVLSAPVNLNADTVGALVNIIFLATAPLPANQAYGYWVDDGTNVILMERFPDGLGVHFAAAGDFLNLGVAFPQTMLQPAQ